MSSYTGEYSEPYHFNDFKDTADEREARRYYTEDKVGAMDSEDDPFAGQSGFERRPEERTGPRQKGEAPGSRLRSGEESRGRQRMQQVEAQQVTAFFKPLHDSQERTRDQRSLEDESRERLEQPFDDHQPPPTFTQNSVTQAIGKEYLVHTNLSADGDHTEPQGVGPDEDAQARLDQDELAFEAPPRSNTARNAPSNRDRGFNSGHLDTDGLLTPSRLQREGARSKRAKMVPSELDFIKEELTQEQFHEVYVFVDQVPISKIKRNLNRDFSDGCLAAEVISYNLPQSHKGLIQVHNYIPTNQIKQKRANWQLLNRKVLAKLGRRAGFSLTVEQIEGIVRSKYGYVERALLQIKYAMQIFKERPTPIPDIAKSTFVPAGDYSSLSGSRSRLRTAHQVDFVQQNISKIAFDGGARLSARSCARLSPRGPADSSRKASRRKLASQASHSLIDHARTRTEPQAMLSTARRLHQRKKRKQQLMQYPGFGSTPQPVNIYIENDKRAGHLGQKYAVQRLTMSQSELQIEPFNNTMSVMAGPRVVTPAASPTIQSNDNQSAQRKEGPKRKQKLHISALSLQELPQNSKSFTATVRSAHLGQQGPPSREAQGGSLLGSLHAPILNSQRKNYLKFQEYQVDFLKKKQREEAERQSSARITSLEQSKQQSARSLIKVEPVETTEAGMHGSLPLPGLKGNLKARHHKNFGSVLQQKPTPQLELPNGLGDQLQHQSQHKDLPTNNATSMQSAPQVQNMSTHSFNPQGVVQQTPPSLDVDEDCVNIEDAMKKPRSPSFRRQPPGEGSTQEQKQQSSGSKAQPAFENNASDTSPNSLRKTAKVMRQNSHGAAGAVSNPSFNNYSQADANFNLNETLNGNAGIRRASKGQAYHSAIQQAKDSVENGLMKELEECHAEMRAKDEHIEHLQQTIEIMREKMEKMNQLLIVKDQKLENLRKSQMASLQLSDGPVPQDMAAEQKRPGRNGPQLATPGTSGMEGQPPPDQQHFKNVSGLSLSQISKGGLSNGQQLNQGGPGALAGTPISATQPFTPLAAGQGEESSVVIVAAEPDTSNDIAALFQQNSQINLVTSSNAQSRQRGGGRTSRRASEGTNQPTVQYAHIHADSRPEEEMPEVHHFRDHFSPNFMTMDEYNSSRRLRKKSASRKTPTRLHLHSSDRPRPTKNPRNTFAQNKQSFGDRPQPPAPNQHAQSQAQGQAYPRGIDTATLDDVVDLKRHFRSIKSDQLAKPRTNPQPKRKPNNAARPKARNHQAGAHNGADLESKIPYYLRRDQKFFSMKEL